jgi:hypothetical protein
MTEFDFGSTTGKWTVVVGCDKYSGKMDLRILRKDRPGSAYAEMRGGVQVVERVHTFEVMRLTLAPMPEGDFAAEGPAWSSHMGKDNETRDLLQALANEAAKVGIYADGRDMVQEMKAVRHHLDDMRKLVFKDFPLETRR